jgi:putative NIF3 family GTP cyclohydrolase 1 type 2
MLQINTQVIIREASELNIDLLLTHHDSWDFIYGLKESCNRALKECGITHGFFHAPLDDAEFGTSASLAKALGIRNCRKVMPYAEIYYGGVIGDMPAIEFSSLSNKLTDILQEEIRCYQNNNKLIQKVAVAAGGGNMTNEMRIAVENGCDTYITGEYVLYSQQYAEHSGMNLFVGSHTNTEILGVESMAKLISKETDIQIVRLAEPNY